VASFNISTVPGARNTNTPEYNHISVSPDDGTGNRMSYLRFENRSDGVHVFFDDVTSPGTTNGSVTFNDNDIATLTPGVKHAVKSVMDPPLLCKRSVPGTLGGGRKDRHGCGR
jgi:hypothetical protein